MTTTPASPERGPAPKVPGDPAGSGRPVNQVSGFPDDADRDDDVDVLYLAGQRPAVGGEWLLITAADGMPGAEFTARVLPADGRRAHGGDVLVHLAAEAGHMEPVMVRVGTWAVMCGRLVPVAAWDRQESEGWPEKIRATVAFAMGILIELEEHGADLAAGHQVDLDDAVITATAGHPRGRHLRLAAGALNPAQPTARRQAAPAACPRSCVRAIPRPEPSRLPLLREFEDNLTERISEARERTWLGEVARLEQALAALRAKKQHAELLTAADITDTPRALS